MWKFIIGFALGFFIATYGVQNTIDKAQGLVNDGKDFIGEHVDDANGQNSN